mmetsp:Transcript_29925/g.47978  ORF Transcript_29925/g.47978 Transcript_29925/m.47978 type:complete len:95 (-) Transcript_29925:36-320(-)
MLTPRHAGFRVIKVFAENDVRNISDQSSCAKGKCHTHTLPHEANRDVSIGSSTFENTIELVKLWHHDPANIGEYVPHTESVGSKADGDEKRRHH